MEKPIKTIKTIIFKPSPDGGVAPGDSLKIMVFMGFIGFSNVLGSLCVIFIGFSNVLSSLCVIFIVFFPMFWAPCVSFLLVFPMFWVPSATFIGFQCFGFPVCSFYSFFNVLRSLGFRDFATV